MTLFANGIATHAFMCGGKRHALHRFHSMHGTITPKSEPLYLFSFSGNYVT